MLHYVTGSQGAVNMSDQNAINQMREDIRRRRARLGISQPELADKAGVYPKTISNIETGRSEHPTKLWKVLDALDAIEADDPGDKYAGQDPSEEDITNQIAMRMLSDFSPSVQAALLGWGAYLDKLDEDERSRKIMDMTTVAFGGSWQPLVEQRNGG